MAWISLPLVSKPLQNASFYSSVRPFSFSTLLCFLFEFALKLLSLCCSWWSASWQILWVRFWRKVQSSIFKKRDRREGSVGSFTCSSPHWVKAWTCFYNCWVLWRSQCCYERLILFTFSFSFSHSYRRKWLNWRYPIHFAGWKANPVEFDSVFNRSRHTFSYGSPDIVPIFCAGLPHTTWNSYPHDFEDFATGISVILFLLFNLQLLLLKFTYLVIIIVFFSFNANGLNKHRRDNALGTKIPLYTLFCGSHFQLTLYQFVCVNADASFLDEWSFDQFKGLLNRSKEDPKLKELLLQDNLVVFLHLLGCDSNGHAHRPFSSIYLNNVAVVDSIAERVYNLLEDYYRDNRTSYVFTADHGMHDKGWIFFYFRNFLLHFFHWIIISLILHHFFPYNGSYMLLFYQ